MYHTHFSDLIVTKMSVFDSPLRIWKKKKIARGAIYVGQARKISAFLSVTFI